MYRPCDTMSMLPKQCFFHQIADVTPSFWHYTNFTYNVSQLIATFYSAPPEMAADSKKEPQQILTSTPPFYGCCQAFP